MSSFAPIGEVSSARMLERLLRGRTWIKRKARRFRKSMRWALSQPPTEPQIDC